MCTQAKNSVSRNCFDKAQALYLLANVLYQVLKVKGWIKRYNVSSNQKKASVILLLLEKIDFQTKIFTRGKKG